MASLFSPQLKRLLSYVRPYSLSAGRRRRFAGGRGARRRPRRVDDQPAVDYVLDPSVVGSQLPLGKIPFTEHVVYLNNFLPVRLSQRLDHFHLHAADDLRSSKPSPNILAPRKFNTSATPRSPNLRNQVYARLIRQPIGFFQHHPTGRLLSAVINDVERTRIALSEYLADLFREGFTLIVFVAVMLRAQLENGARLDRAPSAGRSSGRQIWPQDSPLRRKQPVPPG